MLNFFRSDVTPDSRNGRGLWGSLTGTCQRKRQPSNAFSEAALRKARHVKKGSGLLQTSFHHHRASSFEIQTGTCLLSGSVVEFSHRMKELGITQNQSDNYGRSLLHHAVLSGNVGIVEFLILIKKVDCNMGDLLMMSPLHWICNIHEPKIEIARFLLKNGAGLHQRDVNGNTPLHYACATGSLALVDCLLGYGADATLVNTAGFTPVAQVNGPDRFRILAKLEKQVEKDDAIRSQASEPGKTIAMPPQTRPNPVLRSQPRHHRKSSSTTSIVKALFSSFLEEPAQTQEEITAQADVSPDVVAKIDRKKLPATVSLTEERPQIADPRRRPTPVKQRAMRPPPKSSMPESIDSSPKGSVGACPVKQRAMRPPLKAHRPESMDFSPKGSAETRPTAKPMDKEPRTSPQSSIIFEPGGEKGSMTADWLVNEPGEQKCENCDEDDFPTLKFGSPQKVNEDTCKSGRSLESFTRMSFEGPGLMNHLDAESQPTWMDRMALIIKDDQYDNRSNVGTGAREEDLPCPIPTRKNKGHFPPPKEASNFESSGDKSCHLNEDRAPLPPPPPPLLTSKAPGPKKEEQTPGRFLVRLKDMWPSKGGPEHPNFKKRDSMDQSKPSGKSAEDPTFKRRSPIVDSKPPEAPYFMKKDVISGARAKPSEELVSLQTQPVTERKPPEEPVFKLQGSMKPMNPTTPRKNMNAAGDEKKEEDMDAGALKIFSSRKGNLWTSTKQPEGMIFKPVQSPRLHRLYSPPSKGQDTFSLHRSLENSFNGSYGSSPRTRKYFGAETSMEMLNADGMMANLPVFMPPMEYGVSTGTGCPDRGLTDFSTPVSFEKNQHHYQFLYLPGTKEPDAKPSPQQVVSPRNSMMPQRRGPEKKAPKGKPKCTCGKEKCTESFQNRIQTEEERFAALRYERLQRLEQQANDAMDHISDGTESIKSFASIESIRIGLNRAISDLEFNTAAGKSAIDVARVIPQLYEHTKADGGQIPRLKLSIRKKTHGPSPKGPTRALPPKGFTNSPRTTPRATLRPA